MGSPAAFALEAGTTPPGRLESRLATGLSSLLISVFIIVDTRGIAGYEVGSIADYLAMLILSQTASTDVCGQLPSILDLMSSNCEEGREKPTAMTAGDLAFLRALYLADMQEPLAL